MGVTRTGTEFMLLVILPAHSSLALSLRAQQLLNTCLLNYTELNHPWGLELPLGWDRRGKWVSHCCLRA